MYPEMFIIVLTTHRYSPDFLLPSLNTIVMAATGGRIPCQPNVYQVPENAP